MDDKISYLWSDVTSVRLKYTVGFTIRGALGSDMMLSIIETSIPTCVVLEIAMVCCMVAAHKNWILIYTPVIKEYFDRVKEEQKV
jgi:hypothetical protein